MTDVKNIFKYVYLLYIKYKDKLNTDSDWEELLKESNDLYKKYKSKLAREMIVSVMEQLELEAREIE